MHGSPRICNFYFVGAFC